MRKLRFATAIRNFSKRKGGAERYLVDLCARMVDNGFEVHVYAEHWDEENPRMHYHRIKTIPFPKSLQLISFARRATREMKQGNYDITLGVGNTLETDILQPHGGVHWAWFWRSLRAYDSLFLWTIKFLGRILSPKQWVNGWIEDAPYKRERFSKVIAISDMVKQDILRWYGISEDRIDVIYNGVDIERFHPRNRQYREEIRKRYGIGDEFVILFVSNNFRMKGLRYLLDALFRLKKEGHSPFKLLILGRDRQNPYLRLAKKLEILEEVIFAGSTDEPEKYYGAADILAHPTFYDACSLTVLEALASGLPVITTLSNGASGILTNGQGGFVIKDPRDIKILCEKIAYFFDEGKRQESSFHAHQCMRRYSVERNYSEMVANLLGIIDSKKISYG
jgi:UDP-glucose:(heptosyl)LPS alpha-1,3-glucosyltransferase